MKYTEHREQKFSAHAGGFKVDPNKRQDYAHTLDAKLRTMTNPTWTALQEAILASTTQTFGAASKIWYDEECKRLRKGPKYILDANRYKQLEKTYNALTRKKKRKYILEREKSDLITFIKNPRKGWKQVKGRQKQVTRNASDATMLDYVTKLYNHAHATQMGKEDLSVTCTSPSTFEDIEDGLKKMANGKASDY